MQQLDQGTCANANSHPAHVVVPPYGVCVQVLVDGKNFSAAVMDFNEAINRTPGVPTCSWRKHDFFVYVIITLLYYFMWFA
jgi:hypothetical protein